MPVSVIRNGIADRLLSWSLHVAYKSPRSTTERGLFASDTSLGLPEAAFAGDWLGERSKPPRRKEVWLNVSFILHSVRRRVPGPSIPANVCDGLRPGILAQKKGSRTNRKPLIFFMVPGARLELARCCHRRILSPLRLPIPPSRHSRRPEAHKAFRDYRR